MILIGRKNTGMVFKPQSFSCTNSGIWLGILPETMVEKKNILWEYNEEIFITNGVM